VWGPWQGPLDPIEWMVTITRIAPHQYQYKFEGRDKTQPTAAFVTVLSGAHAPAVGAGEQEIEGFGAGSFTLDWNARATLPLPNPNEIGTLNYTYNHQGPGQVIEIKAMFRGVHDDSQPGRLVDADYAFVQKPQADGSMDFIYTVPATATATGGTGKVRSRWLWSGAGRSDVSVKPTDLTVTYTVNECWGANYLSVYMSTPLSASADQNYGSETDCAFPTAEYSSL
jgi:hypothetical protein